MYSLAQRKKERHRTHTALSRHWFCPLGSWLIYHIVQNHPNPLSQLMTKPIHDQGVRDHLLTTPHSLCHIDLPDVGPVPSGTRTTAAFPFYINHRPVVAIAMQQHRVSSSSTTTVVHHQQRFGSFAWYETMVASSSQLLLLSSPEEEEADDDDCSNRIITATCYIDTDDDDDDTDYDSSSVLDGDSVVSAFAIDDWVPDDWGEVDSVHPDIHIKDVPAVKTVRFDCVQVREFPLTIGSATQTLDEHQCPLELSWTHLPVEHVVVLPPLDDSTENNNRCMTHHHPESQRRRRSSYTMATHRPRRLSLRQRQLRIMESRRQYYESSWRGMNQELC
jgi:hypothetical protein